MFWMLNDQQLISFAESSFSRHTTTITTKLTVRATQSVWFGNMFLSDCSGFYSIQIKKIVVGNSNVNFRIIISMFLSVGLCNRSTHFR